MNDFNLLTCPLSGTHCISAGAGTGKTYAISHLFLRLLLEKECTVDSILVVTFTEAATEELRDRIRKLIAQAVQVTQGSPADETLTAIVSAHTKKKSPAYTEALLNKALYSFDEAPICTIHSFCQRVLKDNAFESSMRFDTELITDRETLLQETVYDYWRTSLYTASPYFVNYLMNHAWSPQRLVNIVHQHLVQPDLQIIPQTSSIDTTPAEISFNKAFDNVSETWPKVKNEIQEILLQSDLHKSKYKKEHIPSLFTAFDLFIAYGRTNPELFSGFIKFTNQELAKATNKNGTPPEHQLFNLCDIVYEQSCTLCSMLAQNLLALKYDLFSYVRRCLDYKKQQNNINTFDDLLTNVYRALKGANRKVLVSSLHKQYRAALIDEFQDTDPVQYAIFKPLFADNENIPLFLIGDPKQAIYSFRGADIFTFIDAAENTPADNLHTLRVNRRSAGSLIHAFNTIFTNSSDPFIYGRIPYFIAEKPPDASSYTITCEDRPEAPFTIWYLASSRFSHRKNNASPYSPITKGAATPLLCKLTAREITRLLTHGTITDDTGTRPIRAGDIAILVRKRNQARDIKLALSEADIPAVLQKAGNIFDTIDAEEINHFLHAVVYPHNHGYIKTALCTALIGLRGNALYTASEQGDSIEQYYDEFREYHDLWNRYGFIRMFNTFLNRQQVRKKLLAHPDGERRLTNILHIMDLLQQQSTENRLSMAHLLTWYATQLNPESPRLEEHELRLESDEHAVQVVTIHRSKGLEYPIVFCPFNWESSRVTASEFIFHDEDNRRIYELGGPESDLHKIRAEKEMLAENLRLLYVAITRAKYKCYLAWGRFNQSEACAPAYLFHKPETWSNTSTVSDLVKHIKTLSDNDMITSIRLLAGKSEGSISVEEISDIQSAKYIPPVESRDDLACRTFSGTISDGRRLSSFSSLTHRYSADAEQPDREETMYTEEISIEKTASQTDEKNIFTFPKGTTAGSFFHAILEEFDFVEKDNGSLSAIITQKLAEFGFAQEWHDTIHIAINNLITLTLNADNDSLCLSTVPKGNTCRELEFYYPLEKITPESLSTLFTKAGCTFNTFPEHLGDLDFKPVKGYMHGFIDLFFTHNNRYYLVDWKSNHLGHTPEYYTKDNLTKAMVEHSYILQYYIYTLALHKYLGTRIKGYSYEKHFGGVFYIFLRGISEKVNANNGIFYDRPKYKAIEIIGDRLLGQD